MNFELADKLNECLKAQQLDTAIQVAEQELKQLANSSFHAVLGRNILHLTPDLLTYIDDFYGEATKYFQYNKKGFIGSLFNKTSKPIRTLKTMYCEMNGFTINYDRWYIDLFAYTIAGDYDDLDWLSDFQYSSNDSLTIVGFEDLQATYQDYMENEKWKDNHLQSCSDICEFLIIHRLQELFRNAFEAAQTSNLSWPNTPIYVTAHDYDLIYRTKN